MRVFLATTSAALLVLMVGPFQGAERSVGLTDAAAHLIGFAVITATIRLYLPSWSMWWAAGLALTLGLGVEGLQALTGRSASWSDVMADAGGGLLATVLWPDRPR